MSTVVAIELSANDATFVAADVPTSGATHLLSVTRIPLEELLHRENPDNHEETEKTDGTALDTKVSRSDSLESLLNIDVDTAIAVLPSSRILYESLSLPFDDRKRLEQVVPLQIQDIVPFEISDFVVDSIVAGRSEDNNYNILSSYVPRTEIRESLNQLGAIGADPKLITPRACAITSLVSLCQDVLNGSFALLLFSPPHQCSLAIYVDGNLKHLREFNVTSYYHGIEQSQDVFTNIRCSIAKIQRDHTTQIAKVFTIGAPGPSDQMTALLGVRTTELELSKYVSSEPYLGSSLSEIAWALGMFQAEQQNEQVIDFRQGEFAYKPTLRNFISAIKDELFYIILAVLLAITWCITTVYSSSSQLSRVEDNIKAQIQAAIPGEPVPSKREVSFIESKLATLQEQMKDLGSLSSLSPLDALQELSIAIDRSIDVNIDMMDIRYSSIRFQGTVPNFPSVGRLSEALEKRKGKFCRVTVNAKGKTGDAGRVRFEADIQVCG